MKGVDLKPELQELIDNIAKRNMYSGNKISESIMRLFEIEIRDDGAGILVPYWLGVLERGRGPWRGQNIGNPLLRVIIYNWIKKHNLFGDKKESERKGIAFVIARKINKEGNKQFRSNTYIDIYKSEREKTIKKIDEKFSHAIDKITMEVI